MEAKAQPTLSPARIHPTAIVHPDAQLGEEVEIGPYCLVGEHVAIGSRSKLLSHVIVNGYTTIGEDSVFYPFSTIGLPSQDRKAVADERSYTTIGSRTTIRENVSIHRASGPEEVTSVGNDCLLLAYVHIAHNCRIGDGVTMSNLAQIAGHVIVEDHATFGGNSVAHQFVRVGRYAFIGGVSKLTRDVPPYFLVEGNPARPYGPNSVGLRRAGFSAEELAELKECYKIMYHSDKNISQALATLKETVKTEPGRHLVAFVEAESSRGILK